MSVTRLKKPLTRRLALGGHDVVVTLSPQGVVIARRYRGRRSACVSLENLLGRFLRDPRVPLEQTELPLLQRAPLSLELVGESHQARARSEARNAPTGHLGRGGSPRPGPGGVAVEP